MSAADNRYINELGVFGTNDFYSSWNTYVLTETGNKFAIRNAGDAGTNYWTIDSNRIRKGDQNVGESYKFELVANETNTSLKKKTFFKRLFNRY